MPNLVAYAALFSWPLVAMALFSLLPLRQALIWSLLGGFLLLPERTEVDLPMIPSLDKTLIPSVAALLLCLGARRRRDGSALPGWLPRTALARGLLALFVATPFFTTILNGMPVSRGGGLFIQGMSLYDAGSVLMRQAVLIIPFLLARRYLASAADHRLILSCLMLAGLAYSLPMLFEVRMSPQLHTWIYGFFPHQFIQQMRGDGFRPVVFLGHGLIVALFCAMALMAAIGLARTGEADRRTLHLLAIPWLALTLVLCKTLGALALALLLAPLLAVGQARLQMLAAGVIAGVVLLYPALRGADLAPTETVLSLAEAVSPERAASLQFRLDNEDRLLEKANFRPLFGWGTWGRGRVYDPDTGADISVTDGRWIITVGQFGWMGYIAEFGLLTVAVLVMASRRRAQSIPLETRALGLILCLNLLDLIPNSGLTPLTWMLSGALLGHVEQNASLPAAALVRIRRRPRRGRVLRPGVDYS